MPLMPCAARTALCALLACSALANGISMAVASTFDEEGYVRWLSPDYALVQLRFEQAPAANAQSDHASLPPAIWHLLRSIPFPSVRLSLTSGAWKTKAWAAPPTRIAPVGAELWAELPPGGNTSASSSSSSSGGGSASDAADNNASALRGPWLELTHALSGLFCASLNLLGTPDRVALTAPGMLAAGAGKRHLYASLPREAVCTENLTPWLKLLPCRDRGGLAALLQHQYALFSAEYLSMSVELRRGPSAAEGGGRGPHILSIQQGLVLVLRRQGSSPTAAPPARRPASPTTGAAGMDTARDVALSQLLGPLHVARCPVASRSALYLPPGSRMTCRGCSAQQRGALPAPERLVMMVHSNTTTTPSPSPAEQQQQQQQAQGVRDEAWEEGEEVWRFELLSLPLAAGPISVDFKLPPLPTPTPTPTPTPAAAAAEQLAGARRGGVVPAAARMEVGQYVAGAGLQRGELVLSLTRSPALLDALERYRCSSSSSSADGVDASQDGKHHHHHHQQQQQQQQQQGMEEEGGSVCVSEVVCWFQVIPWYVRPWLHTLRLTMRLSGHTQPVTVPLRQHLVTRRVTPAQDRHSPTTLDLCFWLPRGAASAALTLQFSKAFLTVAEYPPDAHRGFDVPAGVVSFVDPSRLGGGARWTRAGAAATNVTGVGGGFDGVGGVGGGVGGGEEGEEGALEGEVWSGLLEGLMPTPLQQVYTPGLLVPLAAPDFSMPYNVICLSSTAMAVYFGAVLNLLLRRPSETERDADSGGADGEGGEGGNAAAAKARKRRAMLIKGGKALVLVVVFGGVAMYVDGELREQVVHGLEGMGMNVDALRKLLPA